MQGGVDSKEDDGESSLAKVVTTPPYRMTGKVVSGFQRGSKLLGFPTANLDPIAFEKVLVGVDRGVYCGWVSIDGGEVLPTVLSLGLNPQFQTQKETVEAYIMHKFENDFYGAEMKLLICGFLRAQKDYKDLDPLIAAIKNDEQVATAALAGKFLALKGDELFTKKDGAKPAPEAGKL